MINVRERDRNREAKTPDGGEERDYEEGWER
jgi:hypothetical protein